MRLALAAFLIVIPRSAIAAESPPLTPTSEQVGVVQPISVTEFLKLDEDIQAVYVGGLMEGMAFISYGISEGSYPQWVKCVRSKTLGETTEDVVAFIRQEPNFSEGVSSALAQTLGRRCKH